MVILLQISKKHQRGSIKILFKFKLIEISNDFDLF